MTKPKSTKKNLKKSSIKLAYLSALICLATFLNTVYAVEELSVIQTISKNRKSFVIAKGARDGIIHGQEMIYANDNVSIVCRVKEISRDFSLWVPVDRDANVPFRKDEIVNVNSVVYGNVALNIAGAPYLVNEITVARAYDHFRTKNNFSAKLSFNRGLSQSSAFVSEDKNSSRTGFNVEGHYHYRFMQEFEMGVGLRHDRENYRIKNPQLDIPTTRTLLMGSATYHFNPNPLNKNSYYITLAAGIGKSTTTVNEVNSNGNVTILPEVRIGYIVPLKRKLAMVFEGSFESIAATEEFDDGSVQTTNINNMKFSIGLRF